MSEFSHPPRPEGGSPALPRCARPHRTQARDERVVLKGIVNQGPLAFTALPPSPSRTGSGTAALISRGSQLTIQRSAAWGTVRAK